MNNNWCIRGSYELSNHIKDIENKGLSCNVYGSSSNKFYYHSSDSNYLYNLQTSDFNPNKTEITFRQFCRDILPLYDEKGILKRVDTPFNPLKDLWCIKPTKDLIDWCSMHDRINPSHIINVNFAYNNKYYTTNIINSIRTWSYYDYKSGIEIDFNTFIEKVVPLYDKQTLEFKIVVEPIKTTDISTVEKNDIKEIEVKPIEIELPKTIVSRPKLKGIKKSNSKNNLSI